MTAITFKLSLLLLVLCATTNGQKITVMWPTVVTSTLTVTTITNTICLSLDFAAGPIPQCRRRRRQLWVEKPILAPAEEQSAWPLFIQPTNSLRVEPTAVPSFRSAQLNSGLNGGAYLQPSFLGASNDYQQRMHKYLDFVSLPNIFYRNRPMEKQSRTSKKTTVVYTRSKTVTENEMTTKTNTIGISGCTPSPLPFDICV
ncbi:hypothetical protein DAPPUDRAFT_97049 [Daphnia pulex]|uniref:Uncharacterized protein n=1 Tax=Daphnia pulex TaxID=6669 RepID=E9G0F2_DAPPU|nr:hypothetical protein DAPPUDRAFT_97049 [Daphnia pulex]|eukprot:EFX86895.1 hypothetical protein DAPPUDRAFT_97049 [Daphnia pulex]